MPTVWIDPFIAGAVARSDTSILGHGTDTVNYNASNSRIGTYLNPFRFDDWQSNSATTTTVNGVTIAADTEVRIKGKTMADMTTNIGAMYKSGSSIYPETSNTTYATLGGSADYYTSWAYLSGSNIDDMFPDVAGIVQFPLLLSFPANHSSASWQIGSTANSSDGRALYNAINEAGFTKFNQDGVSGNFCDLAFLKQGYLQSHALSNGDKYHWFSTNGRVTSSSAGWTSETEQNGYSLVSLSQSDTYERQHIVGSNCTFDWSRLCLRNTSRRLYFQFRPSKSGVHHKLGAFQTRNDCYYEQRMGNFVGSTLEVGTITGYQIQVDASNSGSISQVNLVVSASDNLRLNSSISGNNRMKFGSIYIRSGGTFTDQRGFLKFNNIGTSVIEFLEGSSYYSQLSTSNTAALNGNRSNYTSTNTYVYPTNLYRAGVSGHWLGNISASTAANRNPRLGKTFESNLNNEPFLESISLTASNWWEIMGLRQETNYGKLPIRDVGRLICGGSNYKTTANQIGTLTGKFISTSTTVFPTNFGIESNDYDNKPLIIMPEIYGNSDSAALAYNETVNSEAVVVLQGGGDSGYFAYGLELQVPSDYDPDGADATKDNVRARLSLSRSSNLSSAPTCYFWSRFGASNQKHSISSVLSSDQTSPTIISRNISVPSSGLKKINSVLVYIVFRTNSTSTDERLYIHDAYVETY